MKTKAIVKQIGRQCPAWRSIDNVGGGAENNCHYSTHCSHFSEDIYLHRSLLKNAIRIADNQTTVDRVKRSMKMENFQTVTPNAIHNRMQSQSTTEKFAATSKRWLTTTSGRRRLRCHSRDKRFKNHGKMIADYSFSFDLMTVVSRTKGQFIRRSHC
jgi:hypothetical protein